MQKAIKTLSAGWFIGLLITTACHAPLPPDVKTPVGQQQSRIPFAQIDLTKMGHVASKARVQDNHLPVVESLIVTGEQLLRDYIGKHGRQHISKRWRQICDQYKRWFIGTEKDR